MGTLGRAYKEMTLQQLRSFLETARLGSFAAAASALGIAQPTVWTQVHSLERHFGTPLVESSGRGCELTEAGRLLAGLVSQPLAGLGSLTRRFREAREEVGAHFSVGTTSRILAEDLPECLAEYSSRFPRVRVTLRDMSVEETIHAVERGEVDLGLTVPWPGKPHPWLIYEPVCQFEVLLITPRDHPLARRRRVTPEDLKKYRLVNAPDSFKDQAIAALLDRLGVFEGPSRVVELGYVPALRRCVALGLGIGLIAARPSRVPSPDLHERSMARYFPRVTLYAVWKQKIPPEEPAGAFVEVVKKMLNGE